MNAIEFLTESLLPLFDNYDNFSRGMIEHGFDDFRIHVDHYESFAESQGELILSRRVRKELARQGFWWQIRNLSGMTWAELTAREPPFKDIELEQLLFERRSVLAVTVSPEVAERFFLVHLDPCRQRYEKWCSASHENWLYSTALWDSELDRRTSYVQGGLIRVPVIDDNHEAIADFITDVFISHIGDPSFHRIRKGDQKRIQIAKRLSKMAELRFSFDCGSRLSFYKFTSMGIGPNQVKTPQPNAVHLTLRAFLRSEPSQSFTTKQSVAIPFELLAPLVVYGRYRHPAHLASAIAGWAALYRMCAKDIEAACVLACGTNIYGHAHA